MSDFQSATTFTDFTLYTVFHIINPIFLPHLYMFIFFILVVFTRGPAIFLLSSSFLYQFALFPTRNSSDVILSFTLIQSIHLV